MPDEAEAAGLLALMLLQDSRREARVDADGQLRRARRPGPRALGHRRDRRGPRRRRRALRLRRPGPYQLQAAIAALHATATPRSTDWPQIAALYGELPHRALAGRRGQPRRRRWAWPTARTRASACSTAGGRPALERYQPFHAAHAELLRRGGDAAAADGAYDARDRAQRERRRARRARAAARIAAHERSTSLIVVAQLETEMRIARRPRQAVGPVQQVPSACTAATTASVARVVVAEAHEDLVEHDVVEDLDAVLGAEDLGEAPRARAAALDQLGDAVAPERAQRGQIANERARREDSGVQSIASRAPRRQVGRTGAERPVVASRVRDEGESRSRRGR